MTKNKLHAHGHARRHMTLCRCRPRPAGPLWYSAAAANQPRTPHLGFAGTAATAPGVRQNHGRELGLGPCTLCQRRPRPNTGPTCTGIGTSSTNTGQGRQGGGQGNKAPSWQERRHWRTAAAAVQARPAAMHSSRTRQREPQPRGNRAVLVCL